MKISEKDNKIMAFATYFQICMLMTQLLLYKVFYGGEPNLILHLFIVVIAGLPMIRCATIWAKNCLGEVVGVYLICGIILLINIIMFPENRDYQFLFFLDFFFMCLPSMVNVRLIDNKNHIDLFIKLSLVVLVLGEIYFVLDRIQGVSVENDYSMSYSYYMLLPSLAFVYLFNKSGRTIFLLLFGFPFLSMTIIGSRGAVIASAVFFVIAILFTKKKRVFKVIAIALGLGIAFSFNELLVYIGKITSSFGINSRTLYLLQTGQLISHDSGRVSIWYNAIRIIEDNWFTGAGLGADYRILGIYSHNIFLDLLIHFGAIFGGIAILLMITVMIVGFIKAEDKLLYMMLFCYGFIPILVSGTYLSASSFWVYIGHCLHCIGIHLFIRKKLVRIE